MCEVTNLNFAEKYTDIVNDISKSDFIAVDCEFSGLSEDDRYGSSLFDTPADRYEKIRSGMEGFITLQLGISVFRFNEEENYEVSTYTFHLLPKWYSSNSIFSCNSESLSFLCDQNFNFNKLFLEGLSFSNSSNVEKVRQEIEDGTLCKRMRSHLSSKDRKVVVAHCSKVSIWNQNAVVGDRLEMDISNMDPFLVCLIWDEVECQCANVRVFRPSPNLLIAEKTSVAEGGANRSDREKKEELHALVLGFTKLLMEIIPMKKPLVGHNMLLDLMMIYKMFVAPLPTYQRFKKEIHSLFPNVYDTKVLSGRLKYMMKGKDVWNWSTLHNLYTFFKDNNATNMPVIEDKGFETEVRPVKYHNSGFDSYVTGFIFLKMTHLFASWDEEEGSFMRGSFGKGPVLYFAALAPLKNLVNLVLAQAPYVALDGKDPKSHRPPMLLIEARSWKAIDFPKISDAIAKFERADIKPLSKYKALIATTSKISGNCVSKFLKKDFKVTVCDGNAFPTRWRSGVGLLVVGAAVATAATFFFRGSFRFFNCKKE